MSKLIDIRFIFADLFERKTKSRRRYKVLDSFNQRLKESRGGKKGFGVGGGGEERGGLLKESHGKTKREEKEEE